MIYHYHSPHLNEFEKVINVIADLSTNANTSVFYMEPSMEEWPTSNDIFVGPCMWRCRCEFLDQFRLIGRGNYSDPTGNIDNNFVSKQPTPPVSNQILNLLYPNLPWTNNTEKCFPDCLPATWRMDIARTILATVENSIFWQLHAKGLPSSRMAVGDCTHMSLDAVLLMNEQLARSMQRRYIKTNFLLHLWTTECYWVARRFRYLCFQILVNGMKIPELSLGYASTLISILSRVSGPKRSLSVSTRTPELTSFDVFSDRRQLPPPRSMLSSRRSIFTVSFASLMYLRCLTNNMTGEVHKIVK